MELNNEDIDFIVRFLNGETNIGGPFGPIQNSHHKLKVEGEIIAYCLTPSKRIKHYIRQEDEFDFKFSKEDILEIGYLDENYIFLKNKDEMTEMIEAVFETIAKKHRLNDNLILTDSNTFTKLLDGMSYIEALDEIRGSYSEFDLARLEKEEVLEMLYKDERTKLELITEEGDNWTVKMASGNTADCKILSINKNEYYRTPSGVEGNKYSTLNRMLSGIKQVFKNRTGNEVDKAIFTHNKRVFREECEM